jgi:hypothetical protein
MSGSPAGVVYQWQFGYQLGTERTIALFNVATL